MAKKTRNTNYAVTNIGNTSKNKCWCGTWLNHWTNHTGRSRATCAVVPCANPAQVGAHVRIDDGRHYGVWYIVPMCKKHNIWHNYDHMYIDRRTALVPACVARTCAKSEFWL